MKRNFLKYLPLAAVVLLLAACGQDQQRGIFATIEETRAIDLDNAMPDRAKILSFSEIGSSHLLAAIGNQLMFRRTGLSQDWQEAPLPSGNDYALHAAVFGSGDSHVGGVFSSGSTRRFRYAEASEVTSSSSSGIWKTPGSFAGSPYAVFAAGNGLLLATETDSGKRVYHVGTDGSTAQLAVDDTASLARLVQVQLIDDDLYILTTSALYTADVAGGIDVATFTKNDDLSSSGTKGFTDLLVDGDDIYITTRAGFVLSSDDGTTWNTTNTYQRNDNDVPLLSIEKVSPASGDPTILVGTKGHGFAVLEGGQLVSPDSSAYTHRNFGGSELRTSTIQLLFQPAPQDGTTVVFGGSGGRGLWRGDLSGNEFTWGRE
ncbi:hypothetical protein [Spirochaeta africana]|uniref:BNR/Asp-box repeat protein n=1 Tax=Spirochaeta africana (strain ATCC 700263 / DSM 8902 / Z-7692) TaxID=889378 RepID=H9UJI6_SPIAZ|nr:hypothetical protein [Spirochaeta africana]AFG37679.1 hypothetical protein Spiaf_1621 [Spirochaeta africana DSM 8902]